jgi:hypothetical protein
MTKSFKITYNGKEEEVEINDKPAAGVMMRIIEKGFSFKAGIPEPKLHELVLGLATSLIVKAPWKLHDETAINNMDWETFTDLCAKIGDVYPVESFLYPLAKLIYGRKFELSAASASQTESTMSAPSSASPSGT